MKQEAICHYTDTPLTLPRGGHAASRQHYQYPQMTRKNLSVPSKRFGSLPHLSLIIAVFGLYPFSTLKSGRDLAAVQVRRAAAPNWPFSTLKAGRDLAARSGVAQLPPGSKLSVPSKRVETLPL